MNVQLSDALNQFVQRKVQSGEYPSPESVVEEALRHLQSRDESVRDDLIDHDFVEECRREADESITLEDVWRATSSIQGSMSDVISEEERAERF